MQSFFVSIKYHLLWFAERGVRIIIIYLYTQFISAHSLLKPSYFPNDWEGQAKFFPWYLCHHIEEDGHCKTYIVGEMFDTEPTFQQQKSMSEHTSQRSNCWRSSQHWFVMEMFLSWWKYFWLLLWKYNSVRGRTQPALFSISCWI